MVVSRQICWFSAQKYGPQPNVPNGVLQSPLPEMSSPPAAASQVLTTTLPSHTHTSGLLGGHVPGTAAHVPSLSLLPHASSGKSQ